MARGALGRASGHKAELREGLDSHDHHRLAKRRPTGTIGPLSLMRGFP